MAARLGTGRALLLALALGSPFWGLGGPLVEIDDARYAEIPREMVAAGDWTAPTLNGLPYVEKPPLLYWAVAASYSAFGVSEAAARLPLALLSLLGLLGTWWLGSWLYSPRTGAAAAVALASSALYFFLSHYLTPDLPLTVFLLWSAALVLRAALKPADARWAAPLAWAAAGLAVLSKGLVGVVLPAAWTLGLAAAFPALRPGLRSLAKPLGPLLFAALVVPWFAAMEGRRPGFLRFFFIEQHLERFLTPKYNRPAPWYFFPAVLVPLLLPWTPAALSGFWRALREGRRDPGGAALAAWAALVLVFFSLSRSKLATYILPAFPPLAVLCAAHLESLPAWARRLALGLSGLLLLALPVALALPGVSREFSAPALALGACGALLLAGGLWAQARHREPLWGAGLCGLLLGAAFLAGLRLEEERVSARPLAREIARRLAPGMPVYAYGTFLHAVPFYLGRPVDKLVNWVGELDYAMRDPAHAARFEDDDNLMVLAPGSRILLFCRRFEVPYLTGLVRPARVVDHAESGRWALLEIERSREPVAHGR